MKKRTLILPALMLSAMLLLNGCKEETPETTKTPKDNTNTEQQTGNEPGGETPTKPEIPVIPVNPYPGFVCPEPEKCIERFSLDYTEPPYVSINDVIQFDCNKMGCDEKFAHLDTFGKIFKGKVKKFVVKNDIFTHDENGNYNVDGAPCLCKGGDKVYESLNKTNPISEHRLYVDVWPY